MHVTGLERRDLFRSHGKAIERLANKLHGAPEAVDVTKSLGSVRGTTEEVDLRTSLSPLPFMVGELDRAINTVRKKF
jgi:hypothetical protein